MAGPSRVTLGGDLTDGSYQIVADPASLSGRAVHVTQGGVDRYRAITWDRVGVVTDVELLGLVKLVQMPNAIGGGGFCRVDNAAGSDGYDAVFDADGVGGSPDSVHVSKFADGFFTSIVAGTNTPMVLNVSDQFWLRFRIAGTTLGIKSWRRGDPEPAAFRSGTDATYASGRVGLQTVERRPFRVFWFAVALGGATAPGPGG